jgi:hypothetical protein
MKINKNIIRFLKMWLPLAIAIVALSGLVYLSMQQLLRQSANDPQVQLSEDIASSLSSGKSAEELISPKPVEISTSLSPFVMVFDESGKVIFSNALLDGQIPQYPAGVFDYVRQQGQDRVTWQPRPGVRQATVVNRFISPGRSGYVVVGRSLRESEDRSDFFLKIAAAACVLTLAATAVVSALILVFD